ncbi:serine/threonine-protein kinase pim-1-like [Hemibagrus wyckioides]|uniref:serine/threonine-protein kinase pim-1-like n=1 Tax=Hemibagrus wyckioides TaxID=337641 RepID=UPI00266BF23E|nr:serine/threonine-protein kinase pim-1-like [Hemibagrus wyckioides]
MEMVSKPRHCENVVELLEWFETPTSFALVLERPIPCMNLHKFRKFYGGRLSAAVSQTILRQVVRAAKHCCDCGVFHRDIKPENILINPDTLEVKLIDFGCGDLMKDEVYTSFSGTPAYCPPEWIRNNEYLAVPATVWSLGVVLYEILSGNLPFYSEQEISVACLPLLSGLSKECYNLLMLCLDLVPEDRPTLDEILNHVWLKEEIYDGDQNPSGDQDLDTPSSH